MTVGDVPGAGPESLQLLRIEHLTKEFDGVTVLDDVTLTVRRGEVHGLAGHNGSGKSTLIKCLNGFHQPTGRWSLEAGGRRVTRALLPGEAATMGIAFVHQDLGLLPDLTVLENVLLFRLGSNRRPFVSWGRESARAERLFATFGIHLDPRATLSTLRPVEQAQVAIVRAIDHLHQFRSDHPGAHGILVLDEATTFLDRSGRAVLHALIRSISADGFGVLFVSHDIEELRSVTDTITVLREGRVVDTVDTSTVSHDDVVQLIVSGGRGAPADTGSDETGASVDRHHRDPNVVGQPASGRGEPPRRTLELRAEGLAGTFLRHVDLRARAGEILGVTGIIGGGWELVPDLLYGARKATAGTMHLGDASYAAHRATPQRSLQSGIVYVPPDRQHEAIIGQLSVQENVMLPVLGRMFRRGHLQLSGLVHACRNLLNRHGVQPPQPRALVSSLSGGNQQKAVLAKWFQLSPSVILLNEPTQGVDVGARALIMEEIRGRADEGAIVLYASGNWDEVARIADRVVVVADGAVTAELEGSDVTPDAIAVAAYRGTQQRSDVRTAAEIWELVS